MIRSLKFACAALVACSVFSAAPVAVQAHDPCYIPPTFLQPACQRFNLYIGTCSHNIEFYGVYDSAFEVQEVARQMQMQGYLTLIQPL